MGRHPAAAFFAVTDRDKDGLSAFLHTAAGKEVIKFNSVTIVPLQKHQTVGEQCFLCSFHHFRSVLLSDFHHHFVPFRERHYLLDRVVLSLVHVNPPHFAV